MLESRTADHALRGAESELRDRAEALAPILGHSPDVKLLVDEADEGVDGRRAHPPWEARGTDVLSLICVGSRGLGAIRRTRVGNVSTKVVKAAEGPVLVYPNACFGSENGAKGD